MKPSFHFEGADDFDAALSAICDVPDATTIMAALTAGGEVIADIARPLTPYRTGATRASITTSPNAINARPERGYAVYVGPTTDVPSAIDEEFGRAASSSGGGATRAHPFMRPAFDMGGADALDAILSVISPKFRAAASKAKG